MPLADPQKSFDVAVRHLFRHIHDGRALRRNPLLKMLLHGGSTTPERFAADVREHILRTSAKCLSKYRGGRREIQTQRAHAIVAGICAGERPEKTASDLGISARQYYRERRLAGAQLARHLATQSCDPCTLVSSDLFQLCLRRAEALVDQGFPLKAVGLLDDALAHAPRHDARVSLSLSKARALIQYGEFTKASASLKFAKNLLTDIRNAEDSQRLRAEFDLTAADIALAGGGDSEARAILAALPETPQPIHASSQTANEFALSVLLELASLCVMDGRFPEARAATAKAAALEKKIDDPRPDLRNFLAIMKASSREDGSSSVDERVLLFHEALHQSLATASARNALYALAGLVRSYHQMADEERAVTCFNEGLVVARSMDGPKPILSAALAGTPLLSTRYWHQVSRALEGVKAFVVAGSLKDAQLKTALAICSVRHGNLAGALVSLEDASKVAQATNNSRVQANVLRERALILHQLGRAKEASATVLGAVRLAESGTSALSLSQTYNVAKRILRTGAASGTLSRAYFLP